MLSLRKVVNATRLVISFYTSRLKGKSRHKGNPIKIGIEPTTSCNLRCPECISGLRAFTRPTGNLTLEDFRHLTDQVYRDLIYMLFYFQGEPYLNPQFLEMAAYASQKRIYTATSTNGHYLDDARAKATVESGLREVIVSIDGSTQETYAAYRVGGNLEKVKNGVKTLVKWRKELKSATPFIVIQFLVVAPNEHQIEEMRALTRELGADKLVLKTAQIYEFEDGSDLMPRQNQYSRYFRGKDGKYQLKNKLLNQCWKLWQGAEITWDGRVLPCCFDKDGEHVMGKLQENSFAEIWRSQPYEDFRNQLLKSRKEIEMCRNCTEGTQVWA